MRLALVGWVADSGVGREMIDALRHLPVSALFVIQQHTKPTRKDLLPSNIHVHLSPESGAGIASQMEAFMDRTGVDTILTWEVPGSWEFPAIWKRRNLRWVNVIHWDWFSVGHCHIWNEAAVLISPNRMCMAELLRYNLKSTYLPVPVDTDRLIFRERARADHFVSIYGFGGFHNRRAIPQILAAWNAMKDPPPLTIRAQIPLSDLSQGVLPRAITVEVRNVNEPADLYETGDIAVQPSRYEGLGLSMLEAQARGVPTMVVDAPPMNEIASELRVKVEETSPINLMGKALTTYTPSPESIRSIVEGIRGKEIGALSRAVRSKVEERYSWRTLLPAWLKVLSGR